MIRKKFNKDVELDFNKIEDDSFIGFVSIDQKGRVGEDITGQVMRVKKIYENKVEGELIIGGMINKGGWNPVFHGYDVDSHPEFFIKKKQDRYIYGFGEDRNSEDENIVCYIILSGSKEEAKEKLKEDIKQIIEE